MKAELPIERHAGDIVSTFDKHQVVIIAGQTGCGKTTRVPRYLMETACPKDKLVGVTEPRRIAAVSVATYVAQEMGGAVGGRVGYQIRHENKTSEATRIKYMTEGVLLREFLADPNLTRYGCLVLDEVHERGVNQDVIMSLVKDLLPRRPDLKVAVMSATINEERFAEYFDAPIVKIEGRMFPVEIEYEPEDSDDFVAAAADKVRGLLDRTPGDILVFLPDYESIRRTAEELGRADLGLAILMLYGNQTPEEQMAVFSRTGRSVVLATNVAETSITLEGITAVVDTGKIKEYRFCPGMGMSKLQVVDHSKAGCEQRAGRAGRTQPGICCRLFTCENFKTRPDFTEPEIKRVALEQVLLQLKAMGWNDGEIRRFDFIDPPSRSGWQHADHALRMLGALDQHHRLTSTGELMAEIPLAPQITRTLIAAKRLNCLEAAVTIAASFATRPVFTRPIGREVEADAAHEPWQDPRSDFMTLLQVMKAYRSTDDAEKAAFCERNFFHPKALQEINDVTGQITSILTERGWRLSNCQKYDAVGQAVTVGLAANLIVSDGRGYSSRFHGGIRIHPGSSLANNRGHWPDYAVAAEIQETTRIWARRVQSVEEWWLQFLPAEVRTLVPHCRTRDDGHKKKKRRDRHDHGRRRGRRR